MITLAIPAARDLLYTTLERSQVAPIVEHLFATGGKPILFAGAVRDVLLAVETGQKLLPPRDLDIGIAGFDRPRFHKILRNLAATPNRYGGYKIIRNGCPQVDVWRLEDTCGLRILGVSYSPANVLRSFIINVNAVAFDPHTGLLHDQECLQAIRSKRIDVLQDALIHSQSTFAAKSLLIAIRLSLPVTPRLRTFISRFIEPKTFRHESTKVFGGTLCHLGGADLPFGPALAHHSELLSENAIR